MTTCTHRKFLANAALGASALSVVFIAPSALHAQEALEEIVVTAQRREQSLQEVPVSLDVFTGEEVSRQGFRNLDDLSKFSPSVSIEDDNQTQNITIRGFGTFARSLTMMSATPIFLDGIHFGRPTMIKNAFLDVERVEVLKGPQPLFFGMNATAGAFNIRSRRPTSYWEGDLTSEIGNHGRHKLAGAVGGPLTDTFGFRVAGVYESTDGPVKKRHAPDERAGGFENLGGRIWLQWTPTEKFSIAAKYENTRLRQGSELSMGCLTEGILSGHQESFGRDDSFIGISGDPDSLWDAPPNGIEYNGVPNLVRPERVTEAGTDCFEGDYAFSSEGPFFKSPSGLVDFVSGVGLGTGYPDTRAASNAMRASNGADGVPSRDGIDFGGIAGHDDVDTWNALLEMTYEFDDGITLTSETGTVDFFRSAGRAYDGPVFMNSEAGHENIDLFSQHLRLESPAEGYDISLGGLPVNVEFMVSGFGQRMDTDNIRTNIRGNLRRGQRFNNLYEDAQWYSGGWELTFNLMDRQLSISAGGRYTDVSKEVGIVGSGQQYIFDERPCASDPAINPTQDANPATCPVDPDYKMVHPELTTYTIVDPVTGNGALEDPITLNNDNRGVRVDSPIIFIEGANMADLWTPNYWQQRAPVPLNWRSPGGVEAVGFTAPDFTNAFGPWGYCDMEELMVGCLDPIHQDESDYDSQFVVSFTPNRFEGDHTFYAKYVEAFKGPVTDTGQSSIPESLEEIQFDPEYVTAWEMGAKGLLLEGRVRYSVAAFVNRFKDLQTSVAGASLDFDQSRQVNLNAGRQDVKGLEFSIQAAVTDNWTFDFAGALMDGEMVEFDGVGCGRNDQIAAAIDAVENPAGRSADELELANEFLEELGPTARAALPTRAEIPEHYFINGGCRLEAEVLADGTIQPANTYNRSGFDSPYTPNWAFVFGAQYYRPVLDDMEIVLEARATIKDWFYSSPGDFSREVMYDTHGDLNLSAGLGHREGTWRLTGYARNLLEATKSYDPLYDLERTGITTTIVAESAFRQYGVRFEYFFR